VLSKLQQWYSLNMFEKEEERHRARFLLTMLLIYWGGSLIILLLDLLWGNSSLAFLLILGSSLQLVPMGLLLKGKLSANFHWICHPLCY
jgi:hypothetical protein